MAPPLEFAGEFLTQDPRDFESFMDHCFARPPIGGPKDGVFGGYEIFKSLSLLGQGFEEALRLLESILPFFIGDYRISGNPHGYLL